MRPRRHWVGWAATCAVLVGFTTVSCSATSNQVKARSSSPGAGGDGVGEFVGGVAGIAGFDIEFGSGFGLRRADEFERVGSFVGTDLRPVRSQLGSVE